MINKELIQGIAIGALRVEKCNIEKVIWTACGITSHNDIVDIHFEGEE